MSKKYSLAFFKLKKSLENDVRIFWSLAINQEFAQSTLSTFDLTKRITEVTANKPPFSCVDLKCEDFRNGLKQTLEFSRENAVVNIVTDFEVYLFETHARLVSLKPSVLQDSSMQFLAKDIVTGLSENDFTQWFSQNVTDKLVRNKQHKEIIERISKYCKFSLKSIESKIDEWEKWTYVRNSIVHVARKVSSDLKNNWQERFPSVGSRLEITDNELMKLQALAFEIAEAIDAMVLSNIIHEDDAVLLVKELFVRFGLSDPSQIMQIVQKNFLYKMKRHTVEQAISLQKKTNMVINQYDFDSIVSDIDMMQYTK